VLDSSNTDSYNLYYPLENESWEVYSYYVLVVMHEYLMKQVSYYIMSDVF
jgi:hypothetical protein